MKKATFALALFCLGLAFHSCEDDGITFTSSTVLTEVSPSTLELPFRGGEKTVTVNLDGAWRVESQAEWIEVSSTSEKSFTVAVGENKETESRRGEVWVISSAHGSIKVYVTQRKFSFISSYDGQTSFSFTPYGGERTVDLSDFVDWEVSIDPSLTWLKPRNEAGTLVIAVDKNIDDYRTGNFSITTGGYGDVKLTVSQSAAILKASSESFSFQGSGATAQFQVTSNLEWTVETDVDWIEAEREGDNVNVKVSYIPYDPETMTYASFPQGRSGNIVVKSDLLSDIKVELRQTDKMPWGWEPDKILQTTYEFTAIDSKQKSYSGEMELTRNGKVFTWANFYSDFPVTASFRNSAENVSLTFDTDKVLRTVDVYDWEEDETFECDIYMSLFVTDYCDNEILVFEHGETLFWTLNSSRQTFAYDAVYLSSESGETEDVSVFEGQPYRFGLLLFDKRTGRYHSNVGPALANMTFKVKVEEEEEEEQEAQALSYKFPDRSARYMPAYNVVPYNKPQRARIYKYKPYQL